MAGLIVHEWFEKVGGAERVVRAMLDGYPDADLYTLWNDIPPRDSGRAKQSWLARSPLRRSKVVSLPWMLPTWHRFRPPRRSYDWMFVSSHAFAHHAGQAPTVRVSQAPCIYVHSPARYLWAPEADPRARSAWARGLAGPLRAVDRRVAAHHTNVRANSKFIRERIRRAWGIESGVIYPPVASRSLMDGGDWAEQVDGAERDALERLRGSAYVMSASRFVSYKRLDAAIIAGQATGRPVVIAGSGPDESRLRTLAAGAGVPVHFFIRPSDAVLRALIQLADVFVFPAVEDFGIVPVESLALGTPVIANALGGTSETIVDGVCGVLLDEVGPRSLATAVDRSVSLSPDDCRQRALQFDEQAFRHHIAEWIGHPLHDM